MITRDRYISHIRKYSTNEMILLGCRITRDMHDKGCFPYYLNDKSRKQEFFITPWEVLNITFDSIKYSNDYRSNQISEDDFLTLISYNRQIQDQESKFDEIDEYLVTNILFGLSQEEFWFQNIGNELHDFSRNCEIFKIGLKENTKFLEDALKSELDMTFSEYNYNIWILLLASMYYDDFANIKNSPNLKNEIIQEDLLNKIIKYYTASYEDIRKSNIKKNVFFTKPFVETSKGKILLTSPYYLYKLLSNGLYWVIRNYYRKKGSQNFINEFGLWFEKYLEQVLDTYLQQEQFEKIAEPINDKKADWVIISDKYIILLEQKSSLAKLGLKQINPNHNDMMEYLKKLSEGYIQLEESKRYYSKLYNNKIIIKILVHYENLYMSEQIQETIDDLINNNSSDVMMASIYEVEGLIYLLYKDKREFEKLIDKKIKLETQKDINGRSFEKLLGEFNVESDYVANKLKYVDDLKRKILEHSKS